MGAVRMRVQTMNKNIKTVCLQEKKIAELQFILEIPIGKLLK